jgi:coenzyme F420 hydrogenase subunit beta
VAGRWNHSWTGLVEEVLTTDLCTGCSGCVIVCPQDVLTLNADTWKPELAGEAWFEGDRDNCLHGEERGCTLCTRACPRFKAWRIDADMAKWSRLSDPDDVLGVHRAVLLVEATDAAMAEAGQDGGLGSAMLAYALDNDIIDAALVSYVDEGQRARPGVARTRDELLASAGSRYTYSANTLAIDETADDERLGLISVSCQVTIPAVAFERKARKLARRFGLVIGLLCSKTFTDEIYQELFDERYGIARDKVVKVNIKGKLQVWHDTGGTELGYTEIPLKEAHGWSRPGCSHCPDFSAEHADVSLGGIGRFPGKTLTIVRTDLGEELIDRMVRDGLIAVSDAYEHDPEAVDLARRLAKRQRARWPEERTGQLMEVGSPGAE